MTELINNIVMSDYKHIVLLPGFERTDFYYLPLGAAGTSIICICHNTRIGADEEQHKK